MSDLIEEAQAEIDLNGCGPEWASGKSLLHRLIAHIRELEAERDDLKIKHSLVVEAHKITMSDLIKAETERDAAIARYEELKTSFTEQVDAIRAEYVGKYLAMSAGREEAVELSAKLVNGADAIEAATIERCEQALGNVPVNVVGDCSLQEAVQAIRALKPSGDL
jgi:hypothetical protein